MFESEAGKKPESALSEGERLPPEVLRRKLARRRKHGARGKDGLKDTARRGLDGVPAPLPHQDKMEAGFGVGLGGVEAHFGPDAREAAEEFGTEASTMGQDIAFRDDASRCPRATTCTSATSRKAAVGSASLPMRWWSRRAATGSTPPA